RAPLDVHLLVTAALVPAVQEHGDGEPPDTTGRGHRFLENPIDLPVPGLDAPDEALGGLGFFLLRAGFGRGLGQVAARARNARDARGAGARELLDFVLAAQRGLRGLVVLRGALSGLAIERDVHADV